jgi:hypothetical protein
MILSHLRKNTVKEIPGNQPSALPPVLKCKLPGNYSDCVSAKEKSERKYEFSKTGSDALNEKLGTNIKFPFVAAFEKSSEYGYVPWGKGAPEGNHSGVTVATGFDLGGRSETELRNLKISEPLIKKLKPYLGKQKQDACNALAPPPPYSHRQRSGGT